MKNLEKVTPLTANEVNARLPLIRRVAADLMEAAQRRRRISAEIEHFQKGRDKSSSAELAETLRRLRREESEVAAVLAGLEQEILEIGGIVKDAIQGWIDFISQQDGRFVYLSWKPGDETVGYWHRLDDDLTKRRRLDEKRS